LPLFSKEGDNNFPLWQRGNKGDFVNCRSSIKYALPIWPLVEGEIEEKGLQRDYFSHQLQKNNIETGRGYWKSLAAAPLGVSCMRLQAKPGLHVR